MARNLFADSSEIQAGSGGRNLFAEASPVPQVQDAPKGPAIGEALSKNKTIAHYQHLLANAPMGEGDRKVLQFNLDREIKKVMAFEQLRQENPYLAEVIEETSPLAAAGVGFQRGLRDIGRAAERVAGTEFFDPEPSEALDTLERYSGAAQIGRIGGQAAPFLPLAGASAAIPSAPVKMASMGLLGGTEGAAIASGTGGDEGDILTGAALGAALGLGSEVAVPILNRVAKRIRGSVLDESGMITRETQEALRSEGVDIGQIRSTLGESMIGKGKFAQLKKEYYLLEQSGDAGDLMRQDKLLQSQEISDYLDAIPDGAEVDRSAMGESLKEAIELRKNSAKLKRARAYDRLSEVSADTNMALSPTPFKELDIDAGDVRDFMAGNPQAARLKSLLSEFGVEVSGMPVDPDNFIEPLTVSNAERLRKRLNRIDQADTTGESKIFTGPIREALDSEFDTAAKALQAGGSEDVARAAKNARQSHIALKSEFDEKGIVDQLISGKARGSAIPKVESSQVYAKIISPSTPPEQIKSLMASLNRAGSKGMLAKDQLKSQMVMDLMDSAFSAKTRKINGERVFGANAFASRFDQMEPKLREVMSSSQFKKLKALRDRSESLIPPSGTLPKGSAGFFIDALEGAGLLSLMGSFGVAGQAMSGQLKRMGRSAKDMEFFREGHQGA